MKLSLHKMFIKENKQIQLKKSCYKTTSIVRTLRSIRFLIQKQMLFITFKDKITTSNTIQALKIITKKELNKFKMKHKSC